MPRQTGYRASAAGKEKILANIIKLTELTHRSRDLEDLVDRELRVSQPVWKRFVEAKKNIDPETFKKLCQWLGLNWQEIAAPVPSPSDRNKFYGRTTELAELEKWVKDENCRLVILYGLPEIGKNALVKQLKKKVSGSFQLVVWKTFSYGDSVEITLTNLIKQLEPQNSSRDLTCQSFDDLKKYFWKQLEQHCLIILEQEQDGKTGNYDNYKKLLGELIEHPRKKSPSSCILLVTSFEKPNGLTSIDKVAVKSCWLQGVDEDTGLEILKNNNLKLVEDKEAARKLIARFSRYPRTLELIASHICNIHNGNVQEFLNIDKEYLPEDIESIITTLIDNLNEPKPHLGKPALVILDILKDYREPISQSELRTAYVEQISDVRYFTTAIDLLLSRSLLVRSEGYAEYGKTYFFGLEEVTKQVVNSYLRKN